MWMGKIVTLCGWARLTGGLIWAVVTLQPRTSPDDDSRSPCDATTTFPRFTQHCHFSICTCFGRILKHRIKYHMPSTVSDGDTRCLVSPNPPTGNSRFPTQHSNAKPTKCRSSKLGLQVIEDLPLPPIVRRIFIPELNVQVPEQSVRTRARGWNLLFPRNLLHFCNSTICKAETRREVLPTMIPCPNADHPLFAKIFPRRCVKRKT